MASSAFRELARSAMNKDDRTMLDFCVLDPALQKGQGVSGFINRWREWEGVLRQNLGKNRAAKLKRDTGSLGDASGFPVDAANTARAALAMESPLEAEIFLDKARWTAIDGFQGFNVFSEAAMYAYLLKLLLMERRQAFKVEEGFSEYKTLYASIMEGAGEPK
jgi:pyrroloquinoline quinone (PQQ) biosynthesis protein C